MLQHKHISVVSVLLAATMHSKLVTFPYTVLDHCFRDAEAQNLHAALKTNFNNVSVTGQDAQLPISCFYIIAPEMDSFVCQNISVAKEVLQHS